MRALDLKVVLTVRATAFDAAPTGEGKAELERVVPASPVIKVTFVRSEQVKSDRPDLQNAKIVLAGGRGLVDEAEFAEMGKLPTTRRSRRYDPRCGRRRYCSERLADRSDR